MDHFPDSLASATPPASHKAHTASVTVIVPYYNAAPYVQQALNSVFAQTFTDYEIILINDGSPDTAELQRELQPFKGRVGYRVQENRGPGAARNVGIRAAQSEFVAFLDPDDLWEPEYLEAQVAFLRACPEVDVVYCDALMIGETHNAGKRYSELYPSNGDITVASLVERRCNVFGLVTARRA